MAHQLSDFPRKRLCLLPSEADPSPVLKKQRHDPLLGDLNHSAGHTMTTTSSDSCLPMVSERPGYDAISASSSDDESSGKAPVKTIQSRIPRPPPASTRPETSIMRTVTQTNEAVKADNIKGTPACTPMSTPVVAPKIVTPVAAFSPAVLQSLPAQQAQSRRYQWLVWITTVALLVTNFCTFGMWTQSQLELQDMTDHQIELSSTMEKVQAEAAAVAKAAKAVKVEVNVTKEEWTSLKLAWDKAVQDLDDLQLEFEAWREKHAKDVARQRDVSHRDHMERLAFLEGKGYLVCVDDDEADCASWAEDGECGRNQRYMEVYCRKSCGVCTRLIDGDRDGEQWVEE
jgi:ShK domain-like